MLFIFRFYNVFTTKNWNLHRSSASIGKDRQWNGYSWSQTFFGEANARLQLTGIYKKSNILCEKEIFHLVLRNAIGTIWLFITKKSICTHKFDIFILT